MKLQKENDLPGSIIMVFACTVIIAIWFVGFCVVLGYVWEYLKFLSRFYLGVFFWAVTNV